MVIVNSYRINNTFRRERTFDTTKLSKVLWLSK